MSPALTGGVGVFTDRAAPDAEEGPLVASSGGFVGGSRTAPRGRIPRAPGVSVTHDGTFAVVDVQAGRITLPAFDMGPVTAKESRMEYELPLASGPHYVTLTHLLDGEDVGGMRFWLAGGDVLR